MKKTSSRLAAWTTLTLAAQPSLGSEIFRCGNDLIRAGMTAGEVQAKCGEPAYREVQTEPIMAPGLHGTKHVAGYTTIEYWTYDRGRGQFKVRLRFEEGMLQDVERLDVR